jgi:hypothetical protein
VHTLPTTAVEGTAASLEDPASVVAPESITEASCPTTEASRPTTEASCPGTVASIRTPESEDGAFPESGTDASAAKVDGATSTKERARDERKDLEVTGRFLSR